MAHKELLELGGTREIQESAAFLDHLGNLDKLVVLDLLGPLESLASQEPMHLLGHRVSLVLTGAMATRDIPETEEFQDNRVHLVSAAPAKLARQLTLASLPTTRLLTAQKRTQTCLLYTSPSPRD